MTRIRPLFRAAIVFAVALSLIGCGRRGPLEPPPGAADANAPASAPDASLPKNTEIAPVDAASVAPSPGQAAAANPAPASSATTPVKKSFPLDPLL